jgi:hypothetical protein
MEFSKIQIRRKEENTSVEISEDASFQPPKETDTGSQWLYYVGVISGALSVIFIPFLVFLIALPESIVRIRGGTIQNYFPKGGKHNPAVTGSMLIVGWFGHFLWPCFVIGLILGLLL